MSLNLLDFDNIEEWKNSLDNVLFPLMSDTTIEKLFKSKIKYDDVQDLLFKLTSREIIINTVIKWIQSKKVVGYHGTRITKSEIDSIKKNGLLTLNAINREDRLIRVLSTHPKWQDIKNKLDDAIKLHGEGNYSGNREGQAHLTLSKASLINLFNHYIRYGSEFDQRVVVELLGEDGKELLSKDGKSQLIKFAIPGDIALKAAHRYWSVEDKIAGGEVPNIVSQFIQAWSYKITNSSFQPKELGIDCGMVFRDTIPRNYIIDINTIEISN